MTLGLFLPLITALQRIDPNLADASASLGANAWRTFSRSALKRPSCRPTRSVSRSIRNRTSLQPSLTHSPTIPPAPPPLSTPKNRSRAGPFGT